PCPEKDVVEPALLHRSSAEGSAGRDRCTDMSASQVHPATTANQMPTTPPGTPGITMGPTNPPITANPASNESQATAGAAPRRRTANAVAMQLAARARKPSPPAMKCTSPVVLTVVGIPSGVPTGKPSTGSAGKAAATIMLTPNAPRSQLAARPRGLRARAKPAAAATTI